ncbi:MAG: tRNA pseudouridine(55) synthase TruB [Myxococcaceae bacterium]|nr:tRNA pseudouridine(55) synthase TruB [Myxococcaceae bacterium]
MNGVVVIDKPKGPTSFDVVHKVRRALALSKVGHTGTLDPMATGVLPLCLGEATKVAGYIIEADKGYQATVRFGATTDTYDAEGQVVSTALVPKLTRELLESALQPFRGTFSQKPPMYSAIKVNGKKLYELARAGKHVEVEPRTVTVYSLTLNDFSATEAQLSLRCSKGFFVRSLAFDLGQALGCGAHLTALRRTESGPFTLAQALPLQTLLERPALALSKQVSLNDALSAVPTLEVSGVEADKVRHGVRVEVLKPTGLYRVVDKGGELLAIAEVVEGRLKYRRVLAKA